MRANVLVIQFPGVNCEYETLRAVEAAGLQGRIRRWNDAAGAVREADAVILPGGFSYQDRIRAGVVAAKDAILDAVVEAADRGVPVLGICNGAQILVETGIVPGFEAGAVEVALAPNRMTGRTGYYCTWVHVVRGPASCVFTEFMDAREPARAAADTGPGGPAGTPLPLPLAHAEGRFVTASQAVSDRLAAGERVALRYSTPQGEPATGYPHNPNGSLFAIAGLANAGGNALAVMPHPERAAWAHQVPRHVGGSWGRGRDFVSGADLFAPGPGMGVFTSLRKALSQ